MKFLLFSLIVILSFGAFGSFETKAEGNDANITLKGSPKEIGEQYGKQAKEQIKQNISLFQTMAPLANLTEVDLIHAANDYENFLAVENPELLEQLQAMATYADVRYEDLLAFNALEEEVMGDGCTTMLATGAATQSGNAYYHKTRDANRGSKQVVVQVEPDNGYTYIGITSAGSTGIAMGINENGVSVGNNVLSTWDTGSGYGNLVVIRLALEAASDAQDGVDFIENLQRASGSVYAVADRDEAAWVETTANHSAVHWVVDEAMAHTNHYILPGMEQFDTLESDPSNERWSWYLSTHNRLDRAQNLLDNQYGKINIQRLVKISEDQDPAYDDSTYWIDSDAEINGVKMGSVSTGTFDGSKERMWAQLGQPSVAPAIPFSVDRPHIPKPFNSGKQSDRVEETVGNRG
ncbi:C45 family autoproteolytic acyltransferase/hydrolase [Alkalihalophilus sp. As8PL]|uniref:C45 family autoproteolytic acyltransferase/hydrolase n=1 Tax=Alkalihalophilus sp. As8PL TaxID=3237103 RepID=A0AB39BWA6_9BACI